jgi:hypothetical protein
VWEEIRCFHPDLSEKVPTSTTRRRSEKRGSGLDAKSEAKAEAKTEAKTEVDDSSDSKSAIKKRSISPAATAKESK